MATIDDLKQAIIDHGVERINAGGVVGFREGQDGADMESIKSLADAMQTLETVSNPVATDGTSTTAANTGFFAAVI